MLEDILKRLDQIFDDSCTLNIKEKLILLEKYESESRILKQVIYDYDD